MLVGWGGVGEMFEGGVVVSVFVGNCVCDVLKIVFNGYWCLKRWVNVIGNLM